MTDVMTPEQRSRCMSRIRGRNTGPELALRKRLWAEGYRYRLYAPLPGRPDLVFPRLKLAIFVDGCFWHGCPIHGVKPKSNAKFWLRKLHQNKVRDRRTNDLLRAEGWTVLRFWEHEINSSLDRVAAKVLKTCKQLDQRWR